MVDVLFTPIVWQWILPVTFVVTWYKANSFWTWNNAGSELRCIHSPTYENPIRVGFHRLHEVFGFTKLISSQNSHCNLQEIQIQHNDLSFWVVNTPIFLLPKFTVVKKLEVLFSSNNINLSACGLISMIVDYLFSLQVMVLLIAIGTLWSSFISVFFKAWFRY